MYFVMLFSIAGEKKKKEHKARHICKENRPQNHRIVGAGRDLCGSSSPTPLPKQRHLQQAVEDLVQAGLELSPEKETPQPPWATCSSAPSPSEGRSSSSCSDGTSCASVCAHCPLSCRWALLKRAWPHKVPVSLGWQHHGFQQKSLWVPHPCYVLPLARWGAGSFCCSVAAQEGGRWALPTAAWNFLQPKSANSPVGFSVFG